MVQELPSSIEEVIRADGRYPPEAYTFLHNALSCAVAEVYGDNQASPGQHHVTGRQLCEAARDHAIDKWGMLAMTVLARWNITETIDFGNMVYLLIEHDFMKKTDEDSLEDFRDVYDFDEAFGGAQEFDLAE
jgi:uncharacterized repeat protein (TIGR04138 family)